MLALAAVSAWGACRSGADVVRPAAPSAVQDAAGDTTIAVTEPTLVAVFPAVTQAEVDADEELATVLEDYQYHLADAASALRKAGVAVHAVAAPGVRVVAGDPPRLLARLPADGARYLFARPGQAPCALEGVQTDTDLLSTAAACFRLPALRRTPTTRSPAAPRLVPELAGRAPLTVAPRR